MKYQKKKHCLQKAFVLPVSLLILLKVYVKHAHIRLLLLLELEDPSFEYDEANNSDGFHSLPENSKYAPYETKTVCIFVYFILYATESCC